MTTPIATQPTPYSLQASCELSEDHFLTSDLIIGTDDEVIPFVNPYTSPPMVEAIVFSAASGSVYHLQRDPSATAGWTPVVIDLSGNVTNPTDVAVAGNGSAVYMLVFGDPDNSSGGLAWLTQLNSATGWDDGYNATYDDLGFQVLGIDPSSQTLQVYLLALRDQSPTALARIPVPASSFREAAHGAPSRSASCYTCSITT